MKTYDFFYNERHTTESDISITTSIKFVCPMFDACGFHLALVVDNLYHTGETTSPEELQPPWELLPQQLVSPVPAPRQLQMKTVNSTQLVKKY
ncbi:hypothetical protein CYY_001816 [Polysphondylium violaceum]|uniref:Uncharacterized protein n=1 Tax=Polysphondylium violaceum TaxID=133409 RepID=A0A8J4Q129_9MYCE|nr:hypothetical protein CYY_001816 [Polysphondylium violaceum]